MPFLNFQQSDRKSKEGGGDNDYSSYVVDGSDVPLLWEILAVTGLDSLETILVHGIGEGLPV